MSEILVWQGPGGWNPDLGRVEPGREFRVGRDITAEQAASFRHWGLMQSRKEAKGAKNGQEMGSRKDAKGAKDGQEMGLRKDAKGAKEAQTQEREEG